MRRFTVYPNESVLDVGTGCGVIAVFAAERDAKKVVALDRNPAAIRATKINAARHGFAEVIDARCSDLFAKVRADERFDVITVNLPYRNKTAKDVVEVSFWDTGFQTYQRFFEEVNRYLNPGGRIYLAQANYGDITLGKRLARTTGLTMKCVGRKKMPDKDPRIFFVFELRQQPSLNKKSCCNRLSKNI